VDIQEFFLRIAQQVHHLAHTVQLKEAVAVVQMALHAEIDEAVYEIQRFLISLFQIFHTHEPAPILYPHENTNPAFLQGTPGSIVWRLLLYLAITSTSNT
jgi:hypothetical protein